MDKYLELYVFLYHSAKKLISEFENLLLIVKSEKFPGELGEFVRKLQCLADHATHEIEALTPIQEETEEFQITDEMCDEAFRAGLAAKNFSIGFLQRHFLIGFGAAVKLQDKLLFDKKITRAFLAGDVLCKG